MRFDGFDISQFLAMGGYALYVWPAYVLAGIVLGGLVLQSLRAAWVAHRRLAAESNPGSSANDPGLPGNSPAP